MGFKAQRAERASSKNPGGATLKNQKSNIKDQKLDIRDVGCYNRLRVINFFAMLKNLFPFSAKGGQKDEEENFFPVQKENPGETEQNWLGKDYEGQLSLDVYQTEKDIVVRSTIAGVKPEDLNIIVNNDLLTIRGKREAETSINPSDYLYRECYWGGFSRTIVLPQNVKTDKIKATLKNGLLTIFLPKALSGAEIKVKEEF